MTTGDTPVNPRKKPMPPARPPRFRKPVWHGELAFPHATWEHPESRQLGLENQEQAARAAAHQRGVHLTDEPPTVTYDRAVLLHHPITDAPMLVAEEKAAAEGFSLARPMMRVRMTWYEPLVRKGVQAKHLSSEQVLAAIDAAVGESPFGSKTASRFAIGEHLPVGFPAKVVLAKLTKMCNQGLVDGCTCGCSGQFRRIDPETWCKTCETEVTGPGCASSSPSRQLSCPKAWTAHLSAPPQMDPVFVTHLRNALVGRSGVR
jgi:hypothetical protein